MQYRLAGRNDKDEILIEDGQGNKFSAGSNFNKTVQLVEQLISYPKAILQQRNDGLYVDYQHEDEIPGYVRVIQYKKAEYKGFELVKSKAYCGPNEFFIQTNLGDKGSSTYSYSDNLGLCIPADTHKERILTGWICPVCGGGVKPDVERCPCKPLITYTFTSSTNSYKVKQ